MRTRIARRAVEQLNQLIGHCLFVGIHLLEGAPDATFAPYLIKQKGAYSWRSDYPAKSRHYHTQWPAQFFRTMIEATRTVQQNASPTKVGGSCHQHQAEQSTNRVANPNRRLPNMGLPKILEQ